MINHLIMTDESKTQKASSMPIKAIDLFIGLNKEVNLFSKKLMGKTKILFLSKSIGVVPEDNNILPYTIKEDFKNYKIDLSNMKYYIDNSDFVFIFLPTFWIRIIFNKKIWKDCSADCIYVIASSEGIEIMKRVCQKNNLPLFYKKRVDVARIGHKNQEMILEQLNKD